MSQHPHESTWCAFPSLLPSLSTTDQQVLENAVCAGLCGRHDDADRMFEELRPRASHEPAFVFCRADILTNSSRESERRQLLQDFAVKHASTLQQRSVQILLTLMIEDCSFWVDGTTQSLMNALLGARRFLAGKAFTDLTDVELRCMTMYYESTNNLAQMSNFVIAQNKTCFVRFGGNKYVEVRQLREALQAQQRWRFAATFMQLELKACQVQADFAQSVPAAMQMGDLLRQQPNVALKYRGVVLMGFLAITLRNANMHQLSTQMDNFKLATLVSMTPTQYADWRKFCPTMSADTEVEDIVVSGSPLPLKADKMNSLAKRCTISRNYTKANQVYIKMRDLLHDAVQQRKGVAGDADAINMLRKIHTDYIEFHRYTTHMVYFEAAAVCDYIWHAWLFEKPHRETLGLIQDFEHRHDKMEIPNLLERLFDLGKLSANALGDDAAYHHYTARYSRVINDCSFMREGGGLADAAVMDPDFAIRFINADGDDAVSSGIGGLHLMLKWAAYEISNGQLASEKARSIFCEPQFDIAGVSADDLEDNAKPLFERLCGTETAPSPSSDFIRAYNSLLGWILIPDRKPSRVVRIFTLKSFLRARTFMQSLHLQQLRNDIDVSDDGVSTTTKQQIFDEANAVLSDEEAILNSLVELEAAEEHTSPTDVKERSVHGVLRYCYSFKSQQPEALAKIDDAIAECMQLVEIYAQTSALLKWYHSLVQLIRLKWQRSIRIKKFSSTETDSIIAVVEKADTVFNKIRAGLASPDASKELMASIKGANEFQQSEHYRYAFAALFCRYKTLVSAQDLRAAAQETINALATWGLVAKGKSLMSVLGNATLLTQEQASDDQQADINALTDSLSKITLSAEGARRLTPSQVASLLTDEVVIVDMIDVSYNPMHLGLIALLYRKNRPVTLVETNKSHEDITRWVSLHLDTREHRERPLSSTNCQEMLNELKPLVEPFLDPSKDSFISKGVTIIWSSTGALHRIPVHAISVGKELLIQRNSVIYTQSLALLYYLQRQLSLTDAIGATPTVILNPLPSDWHSSLAAQEVAEMIKDAVTLRGENLDREQVISVLQGSRILDFQGHARFEQDQPLKSALVLGSNKNLLTVKDILENVKMSFPALCTLFACASGRTMISSTDDVLGLPTAFHYAGACNILSTLWPVDDADAAMFSRIFYKHLIAVSAPAQQVGTSEDGNVLTTWNESVNLAKVMQATVTDWLDENTGEEQKLPYHWAGFFMQGLWHATRIRQTLGLSSHQVSSLE